MLRLQDVLALFACVSSIVLSIVSLCGGVGTLNNLSLITYSFNAAALSNGGYVVHWYRIYFLRICRGTWAIDGDSIITSTTDEYCENRAGGFHLKYGDPFLAPDAYNGFWSYDTDKGKNLINTVGAFVAILLGLLFAVITLGLLIMYIIRARRDSRAYILVPALASTITLGVTAGWLHDIAFESTTKPFFWDAPANPSLLIKLTGGSIGFMVLVLLCLINLPWGTTRAYRKKSNGKAVELGDEYLMDNEGLTQVAAHKRRIDVWIKEDNVLGENGSRKEYGRMQTPDSARDNSSVFTRSSMLQRGDEAGAIGRPMSVSSVGSARGRVRGMSIQHPLAQTATIEENPPPVPSPPNSALLRENGAVGVAA